MPTISIREARQRLSDVLKSVEDGASFVITRRGKEVARLEPVEKGAAGPLPDLSTFRASLEVRGSSLTDELLAQRREERF